MNINIPGPVWGMVPLAVYLILMTVVRWHLIAVPTRRLTRAQLQGLLGRWKQELQVPSLQTAGEQALGERIEQLLRRVEDALKPSPWEWLFWPRGAELKAWRLIHDAESLIALGMDPKLAQERLRQLEGTPASPPISTTSAPEAVERFRDKPQEPSGPSGPTPPSDSEDVRPRLYWKLRRYYDERDTRFATLSTAHTKTSWLVYLGLALVGLTLLVGPNLSLPSEFRGWMLFGALGAFLSRCLRILKGPDLPTDYGVFWIMLFLSPVYGALAGLIGVLLINLAVQLEILGQTFKAFTLNEPASLGRLALAAIIGFSERGLDRLVENVIGKLEQEKKPGTIGKSDQEKKTELEVPPSIRGA